LKQELLTLSGVRVFGGKKQILDLEHLDLAAGQTTAVIGKNGAGKSTLIQVAAGLIEPQTGQVTYRGEILRTPALWQKARRQMAVVFQDPLLLSGSVLANVAQGLNFRGISRREIERLVIPWLERLKIRHLKDVPARKISGGEARRVSLARALVLKPQVLFLDEPFTSLDAPTRAELKEDLKEILAEEKITSVLVTHDFTDLPLLADHVVALSAGRIVQTGPPHHLLAQPATLELSMLVGIENIWPLELLPGASWPQLARHQELSFPAAPSGKGRYLCARPEDLKLRHYRTPETNQLPGTVTMVYDLGTQLKAVIDCGVVKAVVLAPKGDSFLLPLKGQKVLVEVPPEKTHLLVDEAV